MSVLSEIIVGWKNYTFPNQYVEKIAKNRIEVCVDCPKMRKNKVCSVCGCFVPAKARSVSSKCPLSKWEK